MSKQQSPNIIIDGMDALILCPLEDVRDILIKTKELVNEKEYDELKRAVCAYVCNEGGVGQVSK